MKHKFFTLVLTLSLVMTMASSAFASTDSQSITASSIDSTSSIKVPVKVTPSNVTAKPTKKGTIVVKWDKLDGIKSYSLYRATSVEGNYKRVKTTKKTKYTDKKIHPKKTYFYKIVAKYTNGTIVVTSNESNVASAKLKIKKSYKAEARAYTGGGRTKTGQKAKVGRIAVDPNVIKLGTWLYVEGYGMCQASDTGSAIKGKKIDLYKNTEKQCVKWGVRKPRIYIIG